MRPTTEPVNRSGARNLDRTSCATAPWVFWKPAARDECPRSTLERAITESPMQYLTPMTIEIDLGPFKGAVRRDVAS